MEKIFVGTITGAFGIKGELKLLSNFEMSEKVFKNNNSIYINDEKHLITNVRVHKNKFLIEIDNIKDINLINKYRNLDIYFNYMDLNLKKDEYLLQDLLTLTVYNNEKEIGSVSKVINDNKNPLIKVNDKFYIPLNGDFIKEVNIDDKYIKCERLEELMI